MSEKRKSDQLSEEELTERELVASDYFSMSVKIRTAELRLKKMREDRKALLAKYPYLSNAVGALHKGGSAPAVHGAKKLKRSEDHPMGEASNLPKPLSPKERIAQKLAQKAGETAQSLRLDRTLELKEMAHDRP